MQGQPRYLLPPAERMEGIWNPQVETQVDAFLALSVTGDPASIKSKLQALISQISADELTFTNAVLDRKKRLQVLQILMDAKS